MIDLNKLADQKEMYRFFAQQFAYPNEETFEALQVIGDFAPVIAEPLDVYRESLQKLSMAELEELYVETFDFHKKSTLYMTYAKLEDGKDRGQMLAKLKATYELYGLEISGSELPDYLPLMCEFISAAKWENNEYTEESFGTLLAVMEDGTYELMQTLKKQNSLYEPLVRAFRETFKLCIRQEVSDHA